MDRDIGRPFAAALGVLGALVVLGLLLAVGFVAALVLVPLAVAAYFVMRGRIRARMAATMLGEPEVWDGPASMRPAEVIEGVAIDVTVEQPGAPSSLDPPGTH